MSETVSPTVVIPAPNQDDSVLFRQERYQEQAFTGGKKFDHSIDVTECMCPTRCVLVLKVRHNVQRYTRHDQGLGIEVV